MLIVMLAGNDWLDDSRIVREAECLASHGHRVHVLCGGQISEETVEERQAVTYHRVPIGRMSLHAKARVMKIHLAVALRAGRSVPGARGMSARVRAMQTLVATAGSLALACPILSLVLVERMVSERFAGWLRGRLKPVVSYLSQPFVHLDEFAARCLDAILRLKPDVVHAHDIRTLSAGVVAADRLGCRLVYDAHELETHTKYEGMNEWTRYWVAEYERILIRRADAVVTVCDSIAGWLAREYGIRRPVVVFNAPAGGSPVLSAASPKEHLREMLNLPPEASLIVYVGWVTVERGLDLCVKALAELPGAHFATVGPRHAATEIKLLQTAGDLGLLDRVHLVDPVPHDQVMSFISSANCSVIAIQNVSLNNNFCFPNKLLDSVIAGVPVAVSNLVELRQFVVKHEVGVVMDESDPHLIAAAIGTLLRQQEQYRPSPAKVASIERQYGWAVQEQKLLDLYRGLL
jgi:glycosyltransferase involved in cell wall biosynthesis